MIRPDYTSMELPGGARDGASREPREAARDLDHMACPAGALIAIPQTLTGNALSTHDGYYSITDKSSNNRPVYAWRRRHQSSVPSESMFLFRAINGAWVIGPSIYTHRGKIQSVALDASCPGDVDSWAYVYSNAWHCFHGDEHCPAGGSGISAEAQCVTEDSYATERDRFTFSPCPSGPPPPPFEGDEAADAAAGGTDGAIIGIVVAASLVGLLLGCCVVRRLWLWFYDDEFDMPASRPSSSCSGGAQPRLRPPPQAYPPPPPRVSVGRSGLPRVSEYSPTRLAGNRPRGPAYSGVEMQRAGGGGRRQGQFV